MITIKTLTVSKPFKYIWLKHITGIDLNQHCAKCLKGEYNKSINNKITTLNDLQLENGIYYLCGVSLPYVWENNFHLAFEYCLGYKINYNNSGISITIENAKALPISENFIDNENINAHKKAYSTCRNWQFANYLKSKL